MVSSFRLPLLLAFVSGVMSTASYGCAGDEPLPDEADAGNDSGLTGGGRRNTSSSSSSSSGGSSSGGSSSGGSSSGVTCDDEPDVDDLTAPTVLDNTDDSVDTLTTVNGILTPGDVDAYRVYCKDTGGSTLRPVANTSALGVKLCLYIACNEPADTIDVTCETGTKKTLDPKTQGCCGTAVDITYSGCSFLGSGTDDVQAYFVIENENDQPADQCKQYNIDYQF